MTFIRQCCSCHAVWNPGTETWDPHEGVIAIATHTYCDVCHKIAKEEICAEQKM